MGERAVADEMTAEGLADEALAVWQGGDVRRAEQLWLRAAEGGSTRAMVNLGRNCLDAGDADGAKDWFLRAFEAGSADGAYWIGRMAFERGDAEEAEAWRWKAADLGDIPTLIWLAYREPDPDPDERYNVSLMTRAAELGSHAACASLCSRAMLREKYDESVQWGERALATREQAEDAVQLARFHAVLGSAYYLVGRPVDALSQYEEAVTLAPEEVADDDEFVMSLREEVANLNSAAGPELTGRNVARAVNVAGRISARAKAPECRSCGSAVPSHARFCVMCGTALGGH